MEHIKFEYEFIDLSQQSILFWGGENYVFLHPDDDNQLIKVVNPERRLNPPWHKKHRRDYRHLHVLRFINEYVSFQLRAQSKSSILALFYGFVETNMGLGMVFERVRDFDGQISLSLKTYVEQYGFSPALHEKIKSLFKEIADYHLILGDCSVNNFLVSRSETGDFSLIIIDGIGEKTLIPINLLSHTWYKYTLKRYEKRIISQLQAIAAAKSS